MNWRKVVGLLLAVLCICGAVAQGSEGDRDFFKEPWQILWKQGGDGDTVSLKTDSIVPIRGGEKVIYRADLMNVWSKEMSVEAVRAIEPLKMNKNDRILGTAFQVEINMTDWEYHVVRWGYVNQLKKIVWLKENNNPWQRISSSEMLEPLAALSLKIYLNKDAINQKESANLARPLLELRSNYEESLWREFATNPWGRSFLADSEIRSITVKDRRSGEEREVFQLLVRTDWSQKGQRELPEFENLARRQNQYPPIEGLEKTRADYMIWWLDFKNERRSYMAGVYLDSAGKPIGRAEEKFLSLRWEDWGDVSMAGALAAYLLGHPEQKIEKNSDSPQVTLPMEVILKNR